MKDDRPVAADTYRRLLLSGFVGRPACHDIQTVILDGAEYYAFLGQYNILHERVAITRTSGVIQSTQYIPVSALHEAQSAIYSNGGSKIYYPIKPFL